MKKASLLWAPLFSAFGILLSVLGGIWVGLRAFLFPGSFPHYPYDWNWILFYACLLIAVFGLVRFWRGRLLLVVTGLGGLAVLVVSCVQAGLVKEFLAWAWLVILAASLGDALIRRIIGNIAHSVAARLFLGLALGFGGLMLVGLLLGVLGGYTLTWTLITLGALTVLTLPGWFLWIRNLCQKNFSRLVTVWKTADLRALALGVGVIAIFLLGPYLWASAPAIRWDSLSYHVSAPQIYIDHHAMVEIPESAQAYWSHYAEMLYTLGMQLAGQPLPGWLHLTMGILAAAITALFGTKLVNARVGILAAGLVISLPLINYEIGSAYMDAFSMAYITAMLFSAYLWWERRDSRWILLAGIFGGLATGLKLNSLPFVIVLGVFVLFILLKRHRFTGATFRAGILFILPVFLLWLPWLIRDGIWTGNPIFPNYNGFFKSPDWSQSTFFALQGVSESIFVRLLRVPWDIVVNSNQFYREAPGGALLALPWLALPWGYLYSDALPRSTRRTFLALLGYVALAILFLFNISWNARYLMPVYPLLALLAAANIETLFHMEISGWKKPAAGAVGAILAIAYLLAGQASVIIRMPDLSERYPYRLAVGMEQQSEFKSRTLPFLPAFEYLDRLPGETKVLSLGVEFRLYTRARIYAPLFSYEAQQVLQNSQTAEDLAGALKEKGFAYLLVYIPEQRHRPDVYSSPGLTPDFYRKYTRLAFAQNRTYLYRLNFDNHPVEISQVNFLSAPGFEKTGPNQAPTWVETGKPAIILDAEKSRTGNTAALLFGPEAPDSYNSLSQSLTIEGGNIFTLRGWARSDDPEASLQFSIQWRDGNGRPLRTDWDWIPVNDDWQEYSLSATAPQESRSVVISLAAIGDRSIWFDDLCFSEGGYWDTLCESAMDNSSN